MAHTSSARPWHLVPIALVLLLWHGALTADYVNARFDLMADAPSLMAALPLETLWSRVAWAMAVWLGLAGAVFLLFGDDAAVLLIFAATVAMFVALAGIVLAGPPANVWGQPWWAVAVAFAFVPLLGWFYARTLKRNRALH